MNLCLIVQWILALAEIFLCYCFVEIFDEKDVVKENKIYFIVWSIIVGGIIIVFRLKGQEKISFTSILTRNMVILISLIIKKRTYIILKFIAVSGFFLHRSSVYVFFYLVWKTLTIDKNLNESIYKYNTVIFIGNKILSICVLVVIFHIILKYSEHNMYESRNFRFFLIGNAFLGGSIMLFSKKYIKVLDKKEIIFYLFFVIIVMVLMIIALINTMKMKCLIDKKNGIEKKLYLMEEKFDEIKKMYRNYTYVNHDLKNHLLVIESYCKEGKNRELLSYLKKIQRPVLEIKQFIKSGNDVLDIIINYKLTEAEKKGIDIKIIWDSENGFEKIQEVDLCVLFSNLLDNALQACEENITEQNRWIHIYKKSTGAETYIYFSNSAVIKSGLLKNKGRMGIHGYGLRNVRDKVKKYKGTMWIEKEKDKFIVRIIL